MTVRIAPLINDREPVHNESEQERTSRLAMDVYDQIGSDLLRRVFEIEA
jgi:hypothetical protein